MKKITHIQRLATQLPDAFTDATKITKSHIPAANTPARIDVPDGQNMNAAHEISKTRQKHGRPIGSKDLIPKKRKSNMNLIKAPEVAQPPEEAQAPKVAQALDEAQPLEDEHTLDEAEISKEINEEFSTNYMFTNELWDRNEIIVDDIFCFTVATKILSNDNDNEPQSVDECRLRHDWDKWKVAIQAELDSLKKRNVFGPIVRTPAGVKPVGYKWVFVRKRNERNEIVRFKARLVAQGFLQRPGIDYEETYSPVMDAITFRYLISLVVSERLEMHLMDVVTAYLYGMLDTDVYMKIPEGFKLPDAKPKGMFSIKLKRSLYGLKQSGQMWYNRLSEYLLKEGYVNNPICPCVFIKKSNSGFAILAVYVDDINLIGTLEELTKAAEYLKNEFEMKSLGQTKYCLGLQIEHCPTGILVHQKAYIEKVLKRFNMDEAHPLSTPMVVRSLDPKNDPFRPKEDGEIILGPEVPYLSAIGALLYLAQCTRPDIAFAVNLLARFSSEPTRRLWNGI